ncbi:MAG: hypothetical protein V9F06_07900 [Thermomicrobiales bacterium]
MMTRRRLGEQLDRDLNTRVNVIGFGSWRGKRDGDGYVVRHPGGANEFQTEAAAHVGALNMVLVYGDLTDAEWQIATRCLRNSQLDAMRRHLEEFRDRAAVEVIAIPRVR